eukprot:426896-Pelagomonas_calceolata.AAC.3
MQSVRLEARAAQNMQRKPPATRLEDLNQVSHYTSGPAANQGLTRPSIQLDWSQHLTSSGGWPPIQASHSRLVKLEEWC